MSSIAIRRASPANPVIAAVTTAQIFALASNALIPATVAIPGKLAIEAKKCRVRAEGNLTTVGAYTAKASLYGAVGAIPAAPFTPGSWTLLGSGTARAVGTTTCPWYIEADVIFDSVSGLLQGTFNQLVNNLYDASAALANALTGINGTNVNVTQGATVVPPADPVVYLAVGLTFGTGGLNIGNLSNFELGF